MSWRPGCKASTLLNKSQTAVESLPVKVSSCWVYPSFLILYRLNFILEVSFSFVFLWNHPPFFYLQYFLLATRFNEKRQYNTITIMSKPNLCHVWMLQNRFMFFSSTRFAKKKKNVVLKIVQKSLKGKTSTQNMKLCDSLQHFFNA